MAEAPPDVTILGAGIVGICTALSLRERGFSVALLDRDPPADESLFLSMIVSEPLSHDPYGLANVVQFVAYREHPSCSVAIELVPGQHDECRLIQ